MAVFKDKCTLRGMNPKKLARKVIPHSLISTVEGSYRKTRAGINQTIYGNPGKNLKIISVTGTNGKTSTCNFINDILKNAGYRTAMFTTAVIDMDGQKTLNRTHRTVPLTKELFSFLRTARNKNVDYVILETTSHSLDQHKMWKLPIDIAVMTNLTQDHLDYHGTMENYAAAKAKLFNGYMSPRVSILNSDDEWFEYYRNQCTGEMRTFGKNKADLRITSFTSSSTGLKVRFDTVDGSIVSQSPLIGEFNAYNLAAAASACLAAGLNTLQIRTGIESIMGVPGRMEMIPSSNGFSVVVDYAHTPDALEKALLALKTATRGKVSLVFGATGDRDRSKRPIMGQVAARLADHIYLTDDETYTENGASIRRAVMEGITKEGGAHKTNEIEDRRTAIKAAVLAAQKKDMILVAGLGHQDYRAMNEGHIPWQESDVVKEILKETKNI